VSRRTALALLAGSAALLAAGCGGGNGSEAITTSSITKPELVKEVNAACEKAEKKIQAEFREFTKDMHFSAEQKPTAALASEVSNTIFIPAVEDELDEIRALGAPKGDASQLHGIVAAIEEGLNRVKADPQAALGSVAASFGRAERLAASYGLEPCAHR